MQVYHDDEPYRFVATVKGRPCIRPCSENELIDQLIFKYGRLRSFAELYPMLDHIGENRFRILWLNSDATLVEDATSKTASVNVFAF